MKPRAQRDAGPPPGDRRRHRDQRRQQEGGEHEAGPERGCWQRQSPARPEARQAQARQERPPQVVHHLPAPDRRETPRAPAWGRRQAKDPGEELPVAPRPSVAPHGGEIVAIREILHDFHIRGQARTREDAFEQVVAEQRRVRGSSAQGRFKGVDLVDALAGEGSLAEQILVDVGDRRRIRVDAADAGKHPAEQRARAPGRQGRRDARLQDAIALGDAPRRRIQMWPVERMRHLADQTSDGIARQLGVRVERDDVTYAAWGGLLRHRHEARVVGVPQQAVQLVELAALALPPHPAPFDLAPDASAVEQEEAVAARCGAVLSVQARDAVGDGGEQRLVRVGVLAVGVPPIRKQRKMQIAFRAREVMDLQSFDLRLHLPGAGKQHRHGHKGPQPGGHAALELEGRQRRRAKAARRLAVDNRHGSIQRGNQAQKPQQDQPGRAHAEQGNPEQRSCEKKRGAHHARPDVGADAELADGAAQPRPNVRLEVDRGFEAGPPGPDQIVAWIAAPAFRGDGADGPEGAHDVPSDVEFAELRAPGQLFDGRAVEIAGGEIHVREGTGGFQHIVDQADLLDQFAPVDVRHQPHA